MPTIELNYKDLKKKTYTDVLKCKKLITLYTGSVLKKIEQLQKQGILLNYCKLDEYTSAENVEKMLKEDKTKSLIFFIGEDKHCVGATMLKSKERNGYWGQNDQDANYIEGYDKKKELSPKIKARYITGLVVDPKYKGQHKGVDCMIALGEYAKTKKIKKIRLDCVAGLGDNSYLENAYSGFGFTCVAKGYKEPATINGIHYSDYRYVLFEITPEELIKVNSLKKEELKNKTHNVNNID